MLMYSFLLTLFSIPHAKVLSLSIVIIALFEGILYNYRKSIKEEYRGQKPEVLSIEEAERVSLQYFSKLHIVGLVRTSYIVVIIMTLIAVYDIRAFSFFAVAFGAIIIALRDVIVSLIAYPHVVLSYDIGDDVRVGGVFGEIVRVRLLSVQLAGKDERGEHNGKLHIIPNSRFLLESVEKQEIKNRSYRKIEFCPVFNPEEYEITFAEWLPLLKTKLDATLTKRSLKDVGNFKSHAGMRHKLHYDYDKDGYVVVHISFISSSKTAFEKKEQIISFIESTKSQKTSH